jgi:hydrogenase-4 component H
VKLSDKIYEMAVFDRAGNVEYQEKELLVCESCGVVITTVEHLNFMHRKLGPKAFASVLNLNMLNRKLKLAEGHDLSAQVSDILQRKDMFSIICPNCLRQVTVKYIIKGA